MKAFEVNPEGVSSAELVVGIPSYNEASAIATPTTQADKGLSKFFPDRKSVIVNCDNNSPDGTRQAFLDTPTKHPKIYVSTPDGVTGKGNNLRNLFEKSVELSAKAIIVVDADIKSITPQWVRNLGEPLFEDSAYVTPLYVRHKYDRLVNNVIVYPLTRALYGRRVRQPIGGEYGFSGDLARTFLESDAWTKDVGEFGIDVWMTSLAMLSRVPVIQSFMGSSKIHRVKDPESDPGPVFRCVIATMFDLMCRHQDFWKEVKWSRPTRVFGFGSEVTVPPAVMVDLEALWQRFLAGTGSRWDLYREILQEQTSGKLQEVASLPKEGFEFPTVLWARVLYDFSWAYRNQVVPADDLFEALVPLYFGRALSFVIETEAMNNQQVEEIIEDQCLQFEKTKPYLLERWFSA